MIKQQDRQFLRKNKRTLSNYNQKETNLVDEDTLKFDSENIFFLLFYFPIKFVWLEDEESDNNIYQKDWSKEELNNKAWELCRRKIPSISHSPFLSLFDR